jgi:hypothetical protein
MRRPPAVCFFLILVPVAGELPPMVRVRLALKVLRRRFGLRCVSLEERRP